MTGHDRDPVLGALAALTTRDVNPRRADALRNRCHALIAAQMRPPVTGAMATGSSIRRVAAPALVVAWCVAYLVEIIYRAASVYGF